MTALSQAIFQQRPPHPACCESIHFSIQPGLAYKNLLFFSQSSKWRRQPASQPAQTPTDLSNRRRRLRLRLIGYQLECDEEGESDEAREGAAADQVVSAEVEGGG
jgi:hypothetical protein